MTGNQRLTQMSEIIKKEDINLAKRELLMEIDKMVDLVADKQALSKYINQRYEQLCKEFAALSTEFNKISEVGK